VSLEWILLGLRLLATIILCVFLGLAFYLIWRQLRETEAQYSAGPIPHTDRLRVIFAAEGQPLVVGQTLPLHPELLLGCGPENIIIVHPANSLARQARLSQKHGRWWLENLGQPEGVKLNHVFLTEAQPLTHGDVILVGDIQFCFETAK
jgi:hypothetical protein